jgi:SAM-dependent methyltransferase
MADSVTGYHTAHLPEDPARAVVWKVVAEHLSTWVPASARVLEIGAGYCAWINNVVAARRVAVDIWPDVVRHANDDVEALVLDASRDLPTLGRRRSTWYSRRTSSNISSPGWRRQVVDDVGRMLKPGGRFIIIQPNFRYAAKHYFDDYTHRSVFTDVSLPNLLRAHGFAIDRVDPRFLPYSMRGTKLPIRPWTVRAYLRSPFRPMAGQMLVIAHRGPDGSAPRG